MQVSADARLSGVDSRLRGNDVSVAAVHVTSCSFPQLRPTGFARAISIDLLMCSLGRSSMCACLLLVTLLLGVGTSAAGLSYRWDIAFRVTKGGARCNLPAARLV